MTAASTEPLLRARGLARRPHWQGLDFDLRAGRLLVVRGPSGSGKTLLLRAICDLDPLDAGELWLEGRARSRFSPSEWRRQVLYLHQGAPVLPGDVAENLRAFGLAVEPERKEELEDELGFPLDSDARRLSGGERQRLALWRALALRPRVLLLDEATSALDEANARHWEGRVRAHLDAGGGALWVTHDDELAGRFDADGLAIGGTAPSEADVRARHADPPAEIAESPAELEGGLAEDDGTHVESDDACTEQDDARAKSEDASANAANGRDDRGGAR